MFDVCQATPDEQIERMLALLEKRDDKHFEGFCEALEANDQHSIVQTHLQAYRVCVFFAELYAVSSAYLYMLTTNCEF